MFTCNMGRGYYCICLFGVVITWGLNKYGPRTMPVAWFFITATLSLPSIYCLRPCVKPQAGSSSTGYVQHALCVRLLIRHLRRWLESNVGIRGRGARRGEYCQRPAARSARCLSAST
ncbi:hypothetical protein HD806DRAFT_506766 [Xylariaceae sp. AK1471]|nr:hypothetical protein HD806DRAFT_506766 [Xylariaceae sp. AK1471]